MIWKKTTWDSLLLVSCSLAASKTLQNLIFFFWFIVRGLLIRISVFFYTSFTCSYIFYLDCTHLWKLPSVFLLFQSLPVFTFHKNSGRYKKNQVNIKRQKEAISSLEATGFRGCVSGGPLKPSWLQGFLTNQGFRVMEILGFGIGNGFIPCGPSQCASSDHFQFWRGTCIGHTSKSSLLELKQGLIIWCQGLKVNFCSEFIQQGHGNQIMGNWA